MKKTYLVEEIIRKTYELEGTNLKIQDEIERIMSDSANIEKDPDYYSYEAKEIGFDDEVQNYLDSFTPKWAREDLEQALGNRGIPPTEENLKKFMELNYRMDGFREIMIQEWFERMDDLIYYDKDKYSLDIKKWKIDDMIVEIRLVDEFKDYYELYTLEDIKGDDAFAIYVDGDMKWNYATYDHAKQIIEGIGYGRKMEVLK